jgi:hypothetical protein
MLFAIEPKAFNEWKTLPQRRRKDVFRPVEVRKRLESLKFSSPIEQHRYGSLSELVHLQPEITPQDYTGFGLGVLGCHFLDRGFLAALNELALPLSIAATGLTKLSGLEKQRLPKKRRQQIKNADDVIGTDFGHYRDRDRLRVRVRNRFPFDSHRSICTTQ